MGYVSFREGKSWKTLVFQKLIPSCCAHEGEFTDEACNVKISPITCAYKRHHLWFARKNVHLSEKTERLRLQLTWICSSSSRCHIPSSTSMIMLCHYVGVTCICLTTTVSWINGPTSTSSEAYTGVVHTALCQIWTTLWHNRSVTQCCPTNHFIWISRMVPPCKTPAKGWESFSIWPIYLLHTCLHILRTKSQSKTAVLNALQVGDVGAQFKFQNHPSHFTTVRLMLRSKQLHNKNALSSHGFSCPNNNEPLDPIFLPNPWCLLPIACVFPCQNLFTKIKKLSTLATFSSPQELTRGIRPKRSPQNSPHFNRSRYNYLSVNCLAP